MDVGNIACPRTHQLDYFTIRKMNLFQPLDKSMFYSILLGKSPAFPDTSEHFHLDPGTADLLAQS
jgi:hypothetical protein